MIIHITKDISKSFKKLPKNLQVLAKKKEEIFRNNPFDARLGTHKLSGTLDGYYAFSVNYNFRILLRFIESKEVLFLNIGTHEVYR